MCPHGYHHSGSMATPALGTRDVRLHIVWIALWSHQSAQTASSERCIVQKVNVPHIYTYKSHYRDNHEGLLLSFGHFAHCPGSLSTLLDWVESPLAGRSLFAQCIFHCSQFENSGDFTMQSFQQCVSVHPVPKCRSCHKAILWIYTYILKWCIQVPLR